MRKVLEQALKNLRLELASMSRGEKQFLAHYRKARLHAFQLEFLSKFLRKSTPANLEIFERLQALTKDIEDRLGAFNETDEMIDYCEARGLALPSLENAADFFRAKRGDQYSGLKKWMESCGWLGKNSAALDTAAELIGKLEDISENELRTAAIKKMAKVLSEIQDNVEDGEYSPRKKSGYVFAEVEPKVHELRREIRKIPMYAGYLTGRFELTDNIPSKQKKSTQSLKAFAHLVDSPLAASAFAKLPKTAVKNPLWIPRPYFLAITKYVSELGYAKDWAQNIERLRKNGVAGELGFDQLDPSLKDVFGRPETFNAMAKRTIDEIIDTQIFRHMAGFFSGQA